MNPEVAGPRNHLVIIQKWTVPKGVSVRRSGDTIVVPIGRTYYLRPWTWKTLHVPWKLDLERCQCTVSSALNQRNVMSSVLVEKSGSIRIQVYNCSEEVICLAARSLGVRIFGVKDFTLKGLSNEKPEEVNGIAEGGQREKIQGNSEAEVRRSLVRLFPKVFDLTEHPISAPMKALRVKGAELPGFDKVPPGGRQTNFRIDQQVRDRDIEELLARYEGLGYISRRRLNGSGFLSPIMPFRKPGRTDLRLVNDFRELNGYFQTQGRTQIDVRRLVDKVPADWKYFSVVDLKDGFFSMPLDQELRHLFEFQFGHRRWGYDRLPQGFSMSPILFSERIAHILDGTGAVCYVDDVIIGGTTPEEHHAILYVVFRRLARYGLKVNAEKAKFFRKKVKFLGYTLKNGKWSLSEYLEEKMAQIGEVRSRRELERHVGILSFARTHVPDVELALRPMRNWVKEAKTKTIEAARWQEITEGVKKTYRRCIRAQRELSLANGNFSRFQLYTDWTDHHTGYMLIGVDAVSGDKRLLDIGSHTLPMTASSFLGELDGIVCALKKTRRLRGNAHTTVFSDNRAVVDKLKTGAAVSDDVRVCRRLEYVLHNESATEYCFLPGTENTGADGLSRLHRKVEREDKVCPINQGESITKTERRRRVEHAHFGHWSADTTLQNAKMEFGIWPGMRQDVIDYVKQCPNCARSGRQQVRDNYSPEASDNVGQRVHLDYTGPFFDGSYLLVIVDAFSRFVQVSRTLHIGAAHAVRELRRWMDKLGPIQELCGDNASSWNSRFFRSWAEEHQIKLRLTPSYFHEGNSVAERAIQTLQGRIRRILNGSTEFWPEAVVAAEKAMNESWHSTIETCPQALALGIDRNGAMMTQVEQMDIWKRAVEAQGNAKRKERERFEWKHPRKSAGLKIGDRVLLRDPQSQSRALGKLNPRWRGIYVVRDRKSRTTWWISRSNSQENPILVHSSQVRIWSKV